MKTKSKFGKIKYLFLALAVISNAFIITYSALDSDTTGVWNQAFTDVFSSIVNFFTKKEQEVIPLTKVEASFSNETTYKYNYLLGYELNEIPLGSAKQIEYSAYPDDATDKSCSFTIEDPSIASISQSGTTASVVGLHSGTTKAYVTSSDGKLVDSVDITVVDVRMPASFTASISTSTIKTNEFATIDVSINGGNLGNNELVNFRYYDSRKLIYSSTNEAVAKVDENGVVYGISGGTTTVSVTNGTDKYDFAIQVEGETSKPNYQNLQISGTDYCYANDMLLDQNSNTNHYQLEIKDGDNTLDPHDFVWSSSNDLLARVDKHGVLRGFRRTSAKTDDEVVTITAKSKYTGQTINKNINVKLQLPTQMYFCLLISDELTIWNPSSYTLYTGNNIKVNTGYMSKTTNYNVLAVSDNPDVLSVTNEGSSFTIHTLKDGSATLTITSEINPNLSVSVKLTIIQSGAIDSGNMQDVGLTLRKSIGHACVFTVAAIFTTITLIMFLIDKKWWISFVISSAWSFLLAGLSEIIQSFVPSRTCTFTDVLIDFTGALVGILLCLLVFVIIRYKNKKKAASNKIEDKGV